MCSITLYGGGCMFGIFKDAEKSIDTYEQVHSILKSLLTYELKELPTRYEFWYRVAIRQEECRSLQAEHRAKISMTSAVGRFHQKQYEAMTKKLAKLERLADIYKLFCLEEERANLNHRLSFQKTLPLYTITFSIKSFIRIVTRFSCNFGKPSAMTFYMQSQTLIK